MRRALNRLIPFDALARWWYLLIAGPAIILTFSLVTGFRPFNPLLRIPIAEGPPSRIEIGLSWVVHPGWKDDLLFAVLGFLLACGVIWLLEEIRGYKQHVGKP